MGLSTRRPCVAPVVSSMDVPKSVSFARATLSGIAGSKSARVIAMSTFGDFTSPCRIGTLRSVAVSECRLMTLQKRSEIRDADRAGKRVHSLSRG